MRNWVEIIKDSIPHLSPDDVHPTIKGYKRIGKIIEEANGQVF